MVGGADGTSEGTTAEPPAQLRIAVMMSGGVSLSVWMGGVTYELDRLRRGEEPYGTLAGLAGLEPTVDLVTGTSAGGLNGTLLAAAIAWGAKLDPLHQLWLDEGDFTELLRPLDERDPPSLLQGDGYFLTIVRDALTALSKSAGNDGLDRRPGEHGCPPLHAIVTTTLMKPFDHVDVDALGEPMSLATHLGLFRFSKSLDANQFGDPAVAGSCEAAIARLARAARSSASYPVAFEPSFVGVGGAGPDGADLAGIADFGASRFTMDGGLLDNEPIDQLLDLIADQPAAASPVRRVLLYVEPLSVPKPPPADQAVDNPAERPALRQVLLDVVTAPMQQSTAGEIDRLRRRSGQHARIRRARAQLFAAADPAELDRVAPSLVETAGRLRPVVRELRSRDDAARWREVTTADPELAQARQNVLTALDLLRRAAGAGWLEPTDTHRAALSAVMRVLKTTAVANRTRAVEDRAQPREVALAAVHGLLGQAMAALFGHVPAGDGGTDRDAAQLLVEIRGIEALARARAAGGVADERAVFEALTDLDVLQSVVTDGQSHDPQEIELVEVSAYTDVDVGPPRPPETSLTGVQLMHFGAFYLPAWRQNDWIFGRLNGSHQLVSMLCDVRRLLRRHDGDVDAVVRALEPLLKMTSPAELADFSAQATEVLTRARRDESDAQAVEDARKLLTHAVAREVAYGIIAGELPRLQEALRADEGWAALTAADRQVLGVDAASLGSAAAIQAAWSSYAVGGDKLGGQAKSPRFRAVVTQAALVADRVLDTRSLPVVNLAARVVRPPLRLVHFVVGRGHRPRSRAKG